MEEIDRRMQAIAAETLDERVTTPLHPAAQGILRAAHSVLVQRGFEGLTLRRVAAESGVSKSLIFYHFDTKDALVAMLVDSLWHDADMALVHSLADLPPHSTARVDALLDVHVKLALTEEPYDLYYTLLPHILRRKGMRAKLARIYASYRRLGSAALEQSAVPSERIEAFASLLLAIGEGLPVQSLAGFGADRSARAFALLRTILHAYAVHPDTVPAAPTTNKASAVLVENGRTSVQYGAQASLGSGRSAGEITRLGGGSRAPAELPPPARAILRAALRLVKRQGLSGLTLDAIASVSKQPRSSVSYYFGDKQGLVAAVFDSVLRYANQALVYLDGPSSLSDPVLCIHAAVLGRPLRRRAFFDLLPTALRDSGLRAQLDLYQRQWRRTCAQLIATHAGMVPQSLELFSALALAAVDGLAIQWLVDPEGFDPAEVLDAWNCLMATGGARRALVDLAGVTSEA